MGAVDDFDVCAVIDRRKVEQVMRHRVEGGKCEATAILVDPAGRRFNGEKLEYRR